MYNHAFKNQTTTEFGEQHESIETNHHQAGASGDKSY